MTISLSWVIFMKVLLSIRPQYVEKIFAGEKLFEFRRSIYRRSNIRTVIVYATRPVGLIVGEFDVDRIISADPQTLWRETRHHAGISHRFFSEYFKGRKLAHALAISDAKVYDTPIQPRDTYENFTPPQSFMYLDSWEAHGMGCPTASALQAPPLIL